MAVALIALPASALGACVGRLSPPQKSGSYLSSTNDNSLSLNRLPAAGYIDLAPADGAALDALNLGGPSPAGEPPFSPFDEYGLYWSDRFSLVEGDALQVEIQSDAPISWFGVDWSSLDMRGMVATCEQDEDGRSFDPQYPTSSSALVGAGGCALTLNYKIENDTQWVVVAKNANPERSCRLSIQVKKNSHITVKRLLSDIPIVKNMIRSSGDAD